MSLASLKRWHWIAISLIVGLLVGYARQQSADDLQERFGQSINSQKLFEDLLTRTEQNRRFFEDITVHSQRVPDGKGGTKLVHVVAGTAFNGHYEEEGGKLLARWRPSFFLAEIPYHPTIDLSQFRKPGGPDPAKQFRDIQQPTVLDFLNVLSQSQGLTYTNAWWRGMGIVPWTIASFLLIGVIWPTIVNLMVFGSWKRPPEEKGIDLSKVKAHADESKKPVVTEDDAERLHELEAELEQNLGQAAPAQSAAVSAPAPVRSLGTAPVEALSKGGPESHAEFGSKKDDFYPTEVHAEKKGKK